MKSIRIAGLKAERKGILERLQKHGVVELKKEPLSAGFEVQDTTQALLTLERSAQTVQQALQVLDQIHPEKNGLLGSLNGRRILSEEEYEKESDTALDSMPSCYDILALDKQLAECRAELGRLRLLMEESVPWQRYDLPASFTGTKYTKVLTGTLPADYTDTQIRQMLEEAGCTVPVEIEVIHREKTMTNLFAVCLKSDGDALQTAFRAIGFAAVSPSKRGGLVTDDYAFYSERYTALLKETDLIESLIAGFAEERNAIRFLYDHYFARIEKYKAIQTLQQSRHAFVLSGYVPEIYAESLQKELEDRFTVAVEILVPSEEEEVPVALCNNAFCRPCESITKMYAMPSKNDVDPSSWMAFFFYLFFGMMLSDAGYGLVITLACLFVLRKFHLEESMRQNIRLFLFSGISTIIWGVLFGSYFGDLIPRFTGHFLGQELNLAPLWINPVEEPMTLLIAGIALGIVHIFIGMGIKFYTLCRSGHWLDALCDIGLWYVTLIGLIALLCGTALGLSMLLSIGAGLSIAGAAGLILTQGRHSKGFGKVIGGIASLYNVTSYASDILSYSRLMALGLATGIICQVVNILGTLASGAAGLVLFIVIFILGNAIGLGINALGAYVHTIRLQYVEFFAKFYDGGGRAFDPFSLKSRYIRLSRRPAAKK